MTQSELLPREIISCTQTHPLVNKERKAHKVSSPNTVVMGWWCVLYSLQRRPIWTTCLFPLMCFKILFKTSLRWAVPLDLGTWDQPAESVGTKLSFLLEYARPFPKPLTFISWLHTCSLLSSFLTRDPVPLWGALPLFLLCLPSSHSHAYFSLFCLQSDFA